MGPGWVDFATQERAGAPNVHESTRAPDIPFLKSLGKLLTLRDGSATPSSCSFNPRGSSVWQWVEKFGRTIFHRDSLKPQLFFLFFCRNASIWSKASQIQGSSWLWAEGAISSRQGEYLGWKSWDPKSELSPRGYWMFLGGSCLFSTKFIPTAQQSCFGNLKFLWDGKIVRQLQILSRILLFFWLFFFRNIFFRGITCLVLDVFLAQTKSRWRRWGFVVFWGKWWNHHILLRMEFREVAARSDKNNFFKLCSQLTVPVL